MSYESEIKEFYKNRDRDNQYERQWGYVNSVSAAYWRLRDELVFNAILSHFDTLSTSPKVLEIGTGYGHELAKLGFLGIPHSHLTGVDLVPERLNRANIIYPSINFSQQDAVKLTFADSSFDIVLQFTCVMHAVSNELQQAICQEMCRVLKPGGIIIWWDISPLTWKNILTQRLCSLLASKRPFREGLVILKQSICEAFIPSLRRKVCRNSIPPHMLPISREKVIQMFSQLKVQVVLAGLDYNVWQLIWPRNRTLAYTLWHTGWLAQHCFALIKKDSL